MPERKASHINQTLGTKPIRNEETPAASSQSSFEYAALDFTSDSIRVIEILPGANESMIKCRMRTTTISEENYSCLSYTWQPVKPRHNIEINGKRVDVGENLYQFLYAARSTNITNPLWIDALCINQSHEREKNHQVSQMGDIYKMSDKVFVWLGVLDSTMVKFLDEMGRVQHDSEEISTQEQLTELIKQKMHYTMENPALRDEFENKLFQFTSLPYWSRMWIGQEIILPVFPYILIETWFLRLDHLANVLIEIQLLLKIERFERTLAYEYMWWRGTMTQFDLPSRLSFQPSLLPLLHKFGKCLCTDRRDHIYALRSLAGDGDKFQVDYSIGHTRLFQNVMEASMTGMALDQLLVLGASAIQVLELRPTFPDSSTSSAENNNDISEMEDFEINVGRVPLTGVASPIWGRTSLEYSDESRNSSCRRSTTCMYLPIGDASDIHIFEYAVEETKSNVVVNYARAYEYIKGRPRMHGKLYSGKGVVSYIWIDKPSEDVHYFLGPNANPPILKSWKIPSQIKYFQQVPYDSAISPSVGSSTKGLPDSIGRQRPLLKPARRYWDEGVEWAMKEHIISSKMFTAALDEIADELKFQVSYGGRRLGFKLEPRVSRSTTLLLRITEEASSTISEKSSESEILCPPS